VTLTADRAPSGSRSITKTGYITVSVPPLVPNFIATPTSGSAPLTVQFTDTTTGSPIHWFWDFGDGTTSTDITIRNPSHLYSTPGTYSVTLYVFNDTAGSQRITKTGYLTVTSPMKQVPGGSVMPHDLNNDGLYEDVNGDGASDFSDVVLFFNQMDWIADNEPISAFDFNQNGTIDFNDIVILFNRL
jgi:PKD repeat protein